MTKGETSSAKPATTGAKRGRKKKTTSESVNLNKILVCKDLEDCPINLSNHIISEESNNDSESPIDLDKKFFYEMLLKFKLTPFIKNK
jgi:hypothetical protein